MSEPKYLAIRNWKKYQTIADEGKGAPEYVKDYVDKDSDIERTRLSVYCTGILDRLYRLRARHLHILHNDVAWLTQQMHVGRKDAPHVPHAIRTLTTHNFIIPTDDENFEASAGVRQDKTRKGKGNTSQEREEVAPPSGGALSLRDEEEDKPYTSLPKDKPKKDCGCPDGLCDLPGVGDAVYYQRHIKKNAYFIPKLTKGYVEKERSRILADTPEDYVYDADPMIKEKTVPLGDGETVTRKDIMRRPRTASERVLLLKDAYRNAKWLFDPACAKGCKEGILQVPAYPGDERLGKLMESELCECAQREWAEGATA